MNKGWPAVTGEMYKEEKEKKKKEESGQGVLLTSFNQLKFIGSTANPLEVQRNG